MLIFIAKVRVTFTNDDARVTINLPTAGPTWLVISKFLYQLILNFIEQDETMDDFIADLQYEDSGISEVKFYDDQINPIEKRLYPEK